MSGDVPRPLAEDERAVLMSLLSVEFPGVDSLRLQAQSARVVGGCGCGCPTVYLEVADDAPIAVGLSPGSVQAEASVRPTVDDLAGGILLFVEDGRLSSLEYFSYPDEHHDGPPTAWPSVDRLDVSVRLS